MEVESQPITQEVSVEAGNLEEGIRDLPGPLQKLVKRIGWSQDELGNPVVVSRQVKWLELDNPNVYLPKAPAEILITVFQGKNNLKRMMEKEVPYEKIPLHERNLCGIMVVHVDDLMVCHDGSSYARHVVDKLGKRFPFGTWDKVPDKVEGVTYCGKEIRLKEIDGERCIVLSQDGFIDGRLEQMEVAKERKLTVELPASEEERANYRSIVGSLQWVATQSRPDLSFETNQLQKRVADLRVADLLRANKAVREAKANRMEVVFRNLGKDAQLIVYSDAGLYSSVGVEIDEREADDILQSSFDRRLVYSQKGGMVGFVKRGSTELRGVPGHINLVDWRSSTNKRVIESSFSGETHAALMALGMGHFSQVLMSELRFGSEIVGSVDDDGWNDLTPMTLVTDCKSIYDTVHKVMYAQVQGDSAQQAGTTYGAVTEGLQPIVVSRALTGASWNGNDCASGAEFMDKANASGRNGPSVWPIGADADEEIPSRSPFAVWTFAEVRWRIRVFLSTAGRGAEAARGIQGKATRGVGEITSGSGAPARREGQGEGIAIQRTTRWIASPGSRKEAIMVHYLNVMLEPTALKRWKHTICAAADSARECVRWPTWYKGDERRSLRLLLSALLWTNGSLWT
ncbi:hypothetical protein AK812_SmicGene36813 [Symbiodinium microadriaticum]|uniref:Reverse transcriptase Ty1/copia-type domain-containing protein n=1 Tax=Symbiodinium microadriaticum TaxID=2951 RepID=A0A1Q9CHY3_SYMMI|nr:hypothetical protein AK812_SmicGene36813 [Symbiodinium microadriaticum]